MTIYAFFCDTCMYNVMDVKGFVREINLVYSTQSQHWFSKFTLSWRPLGRAFLLPLEL